jgi:hypothetical protein
MNRVTLTYYGMVLSGILAVTTFAYSVVLVPTWCWVSTLPSAGKDYISSNTSSSNSSANNYQSDAIRTNAPIIISQEKSSKPVNCGKIIKQIKAGKSVSLPPECEQSYQVVKDQKQAELQAKLEEQKQKEEFRQRDLDRGKQERENQQKLDFERQKEATRQQEQERYRQQAEQTRAAQLERDRLRQEADARRRQEANDEYARQQAKREAQQRERDRQREDQKKNEAIIRLGKEIKGIFKKNR